MNRKNPFRKERIPNDPAPLPMNQKDFCFMSAAKDESRTAIRVNDSCSAK
jgi:hypothetical protein